MTGQAHVIRGDARRLPLPDASVDLIVTSPPYFALRDYGYDGQIGSEATWQEFIGNLLDCTCEWVRVLKPEGSIFVDLGDKYSTGNSGQSGLAALGEKWAGGGHTDAKAKRRSAPAAGMPPKSLLLLPERYRIACVDELGLIARAVICWSKPNGLPESVTDRVRRSHEDWVHLVRQPRYYSAVDEIREPHGEDSLRSTKVGKASMKGRNVSLPRNPDAYDGPNPLGKLPGSVWSIPSEPLNVPDDLGIQHYAAFPTAFPLRIIQGWSPPGICVECDEGRRPVVDVGYSEQDRLPDRRADGTGNWLMHTRAYGRASRSTTITGYACACTPYTDHPGTGGSSGPDGRYGNALDRGDGYPRFDESNGLGHTSLANRPRVGPWREYHLDDWTPPPTRPAVVLDPMGGTGTTALAARALGRVGLTVDLSADYCRLARWRVNDRGELAKVLGVPKPPQPVTGQLELGEVS